MLKECVHHWQIESTGQPTSSGICINCGETRVFTNSIPDPNWDDKNTYKESAEVFQGRQQYLKWSYTPPPQYSS